MKAVYRVVLGALVILGAVVFFRVLIGGSTVTLFSPAGPTAGYQRNLIVTEVLIMLFVVIPMFVLLFIVAWRYRAGNEDAAAYRPEWHGVKSQLFLWAIPIALIAVLAVINWRSAHALDPYKPIPSANAPLTIKVVALEWKWLFIYPQQNIATVNFVEFPAKTPVHFELTADAPMSSFWIPQLGSQIYAMAAMVTQLNLEASTTGVFSGKDTEINGAGYAGMTFNAKAATDADFNAWVSSVKSSSSTLTLAKYNRLAEPSTYNPPAYYSSVEKGLYNNIVLKFMMPTSTRPAIGAASSVIQMIPGMRF